MTRCRDWTAHYTDQDFEWAEASIDAACSTLRQIAVKWQSVRPGVAQRLYGLPASTE